MSRRLVLSGDALTQMMGVAHLLGGGRDLDDILQIIARTVTELIAFDAVAVNVRRDDGVLEVRAVVGPPEVEALAGSTMDEDNWRAFLDSCERWGGLFFSRAHELPADIPVATPWDERVVVPRDAALEPVAPGFMPREPWHAEYALLAPVWADGRTGGQLQGVISVDLPRSGFTPDAEQQMLLELFAVQVGTAVDRISEADSATDRVSLYRAAFVESPLATALLDSDHRLVDVNEAFRMLTDAVPDHITGRLLADYLETDPVDFASRVSRLTSGETATVTRECRLRDSRGRPVERWVDVSARRIDGVHDDPRFVCTLVDQTASRAELETIRHRADHDALTGLTTRPVWLAEVQARLTARARDPSRAGVIGVLFCDLDGFKEVNDADGHVAGDAVLVAVADVLRRTCIAEDALCRWGGDEFAVVATRESLHDLVDVAASITASTAASSALAEQGGRSAAVSMSIGVAVLSAASAPVEPIDLVDAADKALYTAKRSGRSTTSVTRL